MGALLGTQGSDPLLSALDSSGSGDSMSLLG
jgi:hypothetical protein